MLSSGKVLAAVACTLALSAPAFAAEYQIDDGGPFTSLYSPVDQYTVFLNQYTAEPGLTQITQIEFMWSNAPGDEVEVILWSDPNGDGLPDDAGVLWSAPVSGSGNGSLELVEVGVPAVDIGAPGSSFFVGWRALTEVNVWDIFTSVDPDADVFEPGRGFTASKIGAPIDPAHLNDPSLIFPLQPIENAIEPVVPTPTLVIRAEAIPAPGPALACGGLALLGLTRRRRR